MRVFLLDDDPLILDLLEAALMRVRSGWQVSRALDPVSALPILRAGPPDLLLLDANMPEMGGADVLDALGAAAPPTIVLTGDDAGQDPQWQRFSCVRGIVRKPFPVREIADRIEALLHGCTSR